MYVDVSDRMSWRLCRVVFDVDSDSNIPSRSNSSELLSKTSSLAHCAWLRVICMFFMRLLNIRFEAGTYE